MRSIAAAPHIFWAFLFIVVPLIIVIFYAFTVTNPDGSFSFSFSNIASLPDYASIFWLSLELSIIATAVCRRVSSCIHYGKSKAENAEDLCYASYASDVDKPPYQNVFPYGDT